MIDLFYEVHQVVPLTGRRWVYGHISTLSSRDIDRIEREAERLNEMIGKLLALARKGSDRIQVERDEDTVQVTMLI
mgnify:CR=1 FL=1